MARGLAPEWRIKTTFAREFLPNEATCPVFINADLLAAGLSPYNPELVALTAGRLMLDQIAHFWRRTNNSGDVLEILEEGTNP